MDTAANALSSAEKERSFTEEETEVKWTASYIDNKKSFRKIVSCGDTLKLADPECDVGFAFNACPGVSATVYRAPLKQMTV